LYAFLTIISSMKLWDRFRLKLSKDQPIVIVSGLPRSGTSMMMKMLEAGGLPPLTDYERTPDEDNPKGYYEFERVKKLKEGDYAWLPEAQGKAVKVISALLEHLPGDYRYRVLFMQRAMAEILASQREMLIRRGEEQQQTNDQEMADLFTHHLVNVEEWLKKQPNFKVLYLDYNSMLKEPRIHTEQVNSFLGGSMALDKMTAVVDPNLYRQRQEPENEIKVGN